MIGIGEIKGIRRRIVKLGADYSRNVGDFILNDLTEYQVYLAIMDKLGVKLFKFERSIESELNDRSWAE